MPALPNMQQDEKVILQVNMYFGQVEIRVEAIIHNVTCTVSIDYSK
jgi:hypothetical protein